MQTVSDDYINPMNRGVVTLLVWSLEALAVLGLFVFAAYRCIRNQLDRMAASLASFQPRSAAEEAPYKISYAPSDMEWSGSTSGVMPLKTLTYKQYECLKDVRYGFKIVALTPTERKKEQPHKTRVLGLKTIASLVWHKFLTSDCADDQVITDHGLNALEVCNVRY